MNDSQLTSLDKVVADILAYKEPKMLMKAASDLVDNSSVDMKMLDRYYPLVTAVRQAYQKVIRYPIYFEKFYPQDNEVTQIEAMRYHLHSYLHDLSRLEQKIKVLLDALKNDYKKTTDDVQEISEYVKAIKAIVLNTFTEVGAKRNPHQHEGMDFEDSKLLGASIGELFAGDNGLLKNYLPPQKREEIKAKIEDDFSEARMDWINLSNRNNARLTDFVNHIFGWIRPLLNQLLGIKPFIDSPEYQKVLSNLSRPLEEERPESVTPH